MADKVSEIERTATGGGVHPDRLTWLWRPAAQLRRSCSAALLAAAKDGGIGGTRACADPDLLRARCRSRRAA